MADQWTIETVMERMPAAFLPEKAGDLAADVQFHLEGEQGGDWIISIRDRTCTVKRGLTNSARLTLKAQASDYLAIVTGKLEAMSAFAQGKIKLKGDLALAMKLMGFFKLPT